MIKMDTQIDECLSQIERMPYQRIKPLVKEIQSRLENSADVNGQNKIGDTLLHVVLNNFVLRSHNTIEASRFSPENVLDVLYLTTQHKPNPFIKNNQGLTPSMLAAELKHTAEWQLLSSYENVYLAQQNAKLMANLNQLTENLTHLVGTTVKKISVGCKPGIDQLTNNLHHNRERD